MRGSRRRGRRRRGGQRGRLTDAARFRTAPRAGRGFTAGVGNTVRLYLADPRRAGDVGGVRP
ncbi:hypothetical protein CD790_13285 [Streptomyces sp. SAJ15]|nr:hypothetical protein CD790_13285 [Streptomyces sp. SAJ15]